MLKSLARCLAACAMLVAGVLAHPALAEDKVVRERIAIPSGKTEAAFKGKVEGYDTYEYTIGAKAGDVMAVKLKPTNKAAYFNVFAPGKSPGKDEALFAGATGGEAFSQELTQPGDYLIQVYLYRSAARRKETSDFTVTVALTNGAAGPEAKGGFADGLMGGPDYWQIKGIAVGKTVNMRRSPSTSADVVDRLAPGTVLRNKGCKMEGEKRWCNVEIAGSPPKEGWVSGQFLQESSAPGGGAAADDALVPGTNYHAVGRIPCSLDGQPNVKDCEFGVSRGSPGVATIFITLPNKFVRVLDFDAGKVSPQSAVTSFNSTRDQDNTIVNVNGADERYIIPDAVINGG